MTDISGALFVCAMGIGTVFVGLIGIILLCSILSLFNKLFTKKDSSLNAQPTQTTQSADTTVSGEVVAAISAALAEDMGDSVSSFRITSIKKI